MGTRHCHTARVCDVGALPLRTAATLSHACMGVAMVVGCSVCAGRARRGHNAPKRPHAVYGCEIPPDTTVAGGVDAAGDCRWLQAGHARRVEQRPRRGWVRNRGRGESLSRRLRQSVSSAVRHVNISPVHAEPWARAGRDGHTAARLCHQDEPSGPDGHAEGVHQRVPGAAGREAGTQSQAGRRRQRAAGGCP